MSASAYAILLAALVIYVLVTISNRKKRKLASQSVVKQEDDQNLLYRLANEISQVYGTTAHPKDLLDLPAFQQGVLHLWQSKFRTDDLIQYATSDNEVIAALSLEALSREPKDSAVIDMIIAKLRGIFVWPLYFALRTLDRLASGPVTGKILAESPDWWANNSLVSQYVDNFIIQRVEGGEKPTFQGLLDKNDPQKIGQIRNFMQTLTNQYLQPLYEELDRISATQIDHTFLEQIGRIWQSEHMIQSVIDHEGIRYALKILDESLFGSPVQSVLLIGESGVGKTTILKRYSKELLQKGWTVFEAGATEIVAGQIFIGQLEERVKELVQNLDARKKVIWFIPAIHELYFAGRYRYNPTGILTMLLPFIEKGLLRVIGETNPSSYQNVVRQNPRIRQVFKPIKVNALSDEETIDLAAAWIEQDAKVIFKGNDTLREAFHLCKQFLTEKQSPGNLIGFLELTRRHLAVDGNSEIEITLDDLLVTLSGLSGLPLSILDDRAGLDLDDLRELFYRRVMGQQEAVECLVERVAMIKAGLTDPNRPLGVFLFAGPTGTGKTEIAKTLAEFLFGSADRMIRLDMSEFQTPDSISRILGMDSSEVHATSLTDEIRKQPFSVVLLDEFEKAHMKVWDIFLQVFDEGRLTDPNGNTANFRHSIIILTSNLGGTIQTGAGVGFTPAENVFSLSGVSQAITRTFRPEFINRLDRMIIFRPLNRSVMREILYKELDLTMTRRGLRNRNWAVEWEASAIDFLLEKGFTPDLGARPLKRAIEQYLLSPLALTMVNHQVPEGDQFLFVRSDGGALNVEFIDPDVPAETIPAVAEQPEEPEDLDLRQIVLEARGLPEEFDVLSKVYHDLYQGITDAQWQQDKQELFARMSEKGFWDSDDRFRSLGEIEFLDRIEAGLSSAGSLITRLDRNGKKDRKTFSAQLIARLAQQLFLVNTAYSGHKENIPRDAFLKIESQARDGNIHKFAGELADMYIKWAKKRRMQFKILREDRSKCCFMLAVSGFGAYAILRHEHGRHVLEMPGDARNFKRLSVSVQVAVQPDQPSDLLQQANNVFAQAGEGSNEIIRRYRYEPSPLVRDSKRQWRTGRLDLVLDGNFDLMH